MSLDVQAGIDYALLKRHYDNDDYCEIAFDGTEVHPVTARSLPIAAAFNAGLPSGTPALFPMLSPYIVGTWAIVHDPTLLTTVPGWSTTPARTEAAILNPNPPPTYLPCFEAKDLLFHSDKDCWIRFAAPNRVQHFIRANTYMRFHRRCFIFYVIQDTTEGTLKVWMEG